MNVNGKVISNAVFGWVSFVQIKKSIDAPAEFQYNSNNLYVRRKLKVIALK